jgi:hypothetical protein
MAGENARIAFERRITRSFEQANSNGGLLVGMTSETVERLVSKPDNLDYKKAISVPSSASNKTTVSVKVWLWVEKNGFNLETWRKIISNPKGYGRGYFLVFENDRLITPMPSLVAKDFDMLYRLNRDTVANL